MSEKKLLMIKKGLFIMTMFLSIANILTMIFFRHKVDIGNVIFRAVQYTFMLLVLAAPGLLKKWFKIEVPLGLYVIIAVFAFNALVLGDALNFYGRYPWWDSVLHFNSGIILSVVAFWVIHLIMSEKSKYIYLNKYFLSLFIIIFSLGAGAFWEICEYTYDDIFHTNSQQYMETTEGTLIGGEDIPLKGHAALSDTMKDLMLDLGGSLIVAAYEFVKHDDVMKRLSKLHE